MRKPPASTPMPPPRSAPWRRSTSPSTAPTTPWPPAARSWNSTPTTSTPPPSTPVSSGRPTSQGGGGRARRGRPRRPALKERPGTPRASRSRPRRLAGIARRPQGRRNGLPRRRGRPRTPRRPASEQGALHAARKSTVRRPTPMNASAGSASRPAAPTRPSPTSSRPRRSTPPASPVLSYHLARSTPARAKPREALERPRRLSTNAAARAWTAYELKISLQRKLGRDTAVLDDLEKAADSDPQNVAAQAAVGPRIPHGQAATRRRGRLHRAGQGDARARKSTTACSISIRKIPAAVSVASWTCSTPKSGRPPTRNEKHRGPVGREPSAGHPPGSARRP